MFDHLKEFKNKTALILNKSEKFSYKKFIIEVDLFKKKININNKKKLIFVLGKNNLETLVGYIAFIQNGDVVAFIDEKINYLFLDNLIKKYEPDLIYYSKEKKIKKNTYSYLFDYFGFQLIARKEFINQKINDNLMLLMSTSGSTGSPKLVRQSYLNLESNTYSIKSYLNIKEDHTTITTLPITYVYGLSILNTHLVSGCCIVLNEDSMISSEFWKSLKVNKVNSFGGVPYNYQMIDRILEKKIDDLSLKYTTHAGGKMDSLTLDKILNCYKKNNIKFVSMYGSAEATARMSFLDWKYSFKKKGSIGLPIPGGKFFLKNLDKSNLKLDKSNLKKEGELIYKGKNVCMGYANERKDLSDGDLNKGILNTGDIAYKDKDGFYFIKGRVDNYIKIFGLRINLSELENLLLDKGIKCYLRKNEMNNNISIYLNDNKKNEKKIIKYTSFLTSIHPSAFQVILLDKKKMNSNIKLKFN